VLVLCIECRCRGEDGSCICEPGWTGATCNQPAGACGDSFSGVECKACEEDTYSVVCSEACEMMHSCSGNGRCVCSHLQVCICQYRSLMYSSSLTMLVFLLFLSAHPHSFLLSFFFSRLSFPCFPCRYEIGSPSSFCRPPPPSSLNSRVRFKSMHSLWVLHSSASALCCLVSGKCVLNADAAARTGAAFASPAGPVRPAISQPASVGVASQASSVRRAGRIRTRWCALPRVMRCATAAEMAGGCLPICARVCVCQTV